MNPMTVGIFLFNEVEVLDFAGPFEVFALAEQEGEKCCRVVTISESGAPIAARNGLQVLPAYSFSNHPALDILLIPGGYGAEVIEIHNEVALHWILQQHGQVKQLASICTGAFLLAKIGLLNGKKATTHWMDLDLLEQEYPQIDVIRGVKYVDEGAVMTSGGISAGIVLSFHLLTKFFGKAVAETTARRMEYDWQAAHQ